MRQFSIFALALVLLAGFHTRGCKVEAQGIHVNAGINIGGNRGVNHNFNANAFNAGFNHGYGGFNNNVRVFSPFVQSYNYAVPSAVIVAQPAFIAQPSYIQQSAVVVQPQAVIAQPSVVVQPQIVQQTQTVIQPQAVIAQPQVVVQPLTVVSQPLYASAAVIATPFLTAFTPFYGVSNAFVTHNNYGNFNHNFNGNFRRRR